MIPLGQFRDTFIIAIDDEGVAIIDQHVAHERVLFERVMERLTAGRLESQRLLVPLVIEMSADEHESLVARAQALEQFGFEFESFGGSAINVTAVPALIDAGDSAKALLALAHDLEGLDAGAHAAGRHPAHRGDHGVSRGGEGQLPAQPREDDAHPGRAEGDGVLDRLPARPSRDAAPDPARDRKELRQDLGRSGAEEGERGPLLSSGAAGRFSGCGSCSWTS